MEAFDLTGRAVVVTGGTRGIGAAITGAYRAAGARVLVCGRTLPEPADDDFFRADVRDPCQAAALIAEAVRRFGRLDVVVNNAGGSPQVFADVASPRLHAAVVDLNLVAPLHVSQAAHAVLRDQPGGGVILMISSVSGVRPSPGTAAYGAAKAGLLHLAASLAVEWGPGVRVNSLIVGPVDTGAPGSAASRHLVAGRAATPEDVADACLLLSSPLAGHVSGAALAVHGGGEWPASLADLRPGA
ncbi:SDR family oxidoreductase [Actinoplanes sp. DH11]|uniref:SDR family oxidoreductase n=1 Tax=Actinoplanes sp. DH11 TaxID=2857011 RepID=UPI001E53CE41|nr:SDR family oxidoreductase [Actinoplanes sp. DH11]